jgi:integrase
LHSVAHEFARCFEILGHGGIVEACRYFKKHVETGLPDVAVAEAVAKFAEAKKAEGVSRAYLRSIQTYLGRFANHFQCNIATIQPDDLRAYLNGLKVGLVSKNNHRRLMVVLFNFAKDEGWLHVDQKTAAERLGAYKVKEREVEIFTPAEVARLLAHADEDFVPWIVLIAFGGLRNEELAKGLIWQSINFNRGYLIIPASIAKTNRKRKIDLPENALQWLAPYRNRTGPIFSKDFRKPLALACQAAHVKYKRNALRHSFGSYRMEVLRNAGAVALEMGNSAAIVMKHYFDIVERRAAEAYWNIRPVSHGDRKIVRLAN